MTSPVDEVLRTTPFPDRRDEAWKYTRADAFLDGRFTVPIAAPAVSAEILDREPVGARLVWVDGVLDASLGVRTDAIDLEPLDVGGLEPIGFDAVNVAFARDAVRVVLRAGTPPLVLVHVSTGQGHLSAVRRSIAVEPGVRAEVHEHYVRAGTGSSLVTAITEIRVGPGADLTHLRLLDEEDDSRHFGAVRARVAEGARFACTVGSFAARLARVELSVLLAEGADTLLSGLSLLRGGAHVDHHVMVDHAAPRAKSRQRFRALLDGPSRSVFTGRVVVREGAAGTDADQVHRALLLSDDAIVNARPQLEIHADDVKCSHGAAVGSLDAEALFYLRQRGLDPAAARALLVEAFASEMVADVPPSERPHVVARIRRWLEQG